MAAQVTDFFRIFADVMTNERIIQIDSVDAYNKLYGWETLHPLVTVVNHANPMASEIPIAVESIYAVMSITMVHLYLRSK